MQGMLTMEKYHSDILIPIIVPHFDNHFLRGRTVYMDDDYIQPHRAREVQSKGGTEQGRYRAREVQSKGGREQGRYRAREVQSRGGREQGRYRAREVQSKGGSGVSSAGDHSDSTMARLQSGFQLH